MIKITESLIEVLDEEGNKTGSLACTGEVDGYVFHGRIPAEHASSIEDIQTYLESKEAVIKAKAIAQDAKINKPRYDLATIDSLPNSEHIGKLISVNPSNAKPAVVRRKYHGEFYDVPCFVSQAIVNMWTAQEIEIGDYVLVSFIDENPDDEERNIAIVTDKVYNSW